MNKQSSRHTSLAPTSFVAALVTGIVLLAEPAKSDAFLGIGEPPPETPREYTNFFGRAELSPGVPCSGCLVTVVNAPRRATTDANGYYVVKALPPGVWTLTLSHPDAPGFGQKSFVCAAGAVMGARDEAPEVQLCPPVYLTLPGAVSGRVTLPNTIDYDTAVVGIPELGIFAPLVGGGPGYLLTGVGPGWRKVVVRTNASTASLWVYVQPGNVTMNMNVAVPSVPVVGFQ